MSNIVKSKFAGLLRGLLRRFDDNGATVAAPPRPVAAAAYTRGLSPATAPQSKTQPISTLPSSAPAASPGGLQLPLPSIIAVLPIDLRAKLVETPPASAFVSIPVDKVLSQLAHGSVKITFGELRAARPGLFANSDGENDTRQIALPLNEIITRISPTLLSRRAAKKVEAADDVDGPFGNHTQGVNFKANRTPAKAAPTLPPRPSEPASAPAAPNFAAQPQAFVPTTVSTPHRLTPASPVPVASAAAEPAPVKPVFPTSPFVPAAPIPFSPASIAPANGGLNSAPQIPVENPILTPLAALAEKWPDAIKMELIQTDLMSAQVALPATLVETGLKHGRAMILWKNLRTMIRPKPAPLSVHDGVEVELPLKVLAPQFFARQKAAGLPKQKVSASGEIPDFFHSLKQAEGAISSAPAPESAPAPKPAPVPPVIDTSAAPAPSVPVKPVFSAPPVAAAAAADPEQEIEIISAPLAALSEKWPEALRQEIVERNLMDSQVALPMNAVAPAMKRGRVALAWRDLRSWIRPVPAATASVHDHTELELPLQIIAPLFLERQTPPTRPQPRLAIDQSIPSPFSAFASGEMKATVTVPTTEPEPAHPAVKPVGAKASETNFYVWGDDAGVPRVDESEYKRSKATATDFTRRNAMPKEIVEHAMALPGVAGVVIALCDGLMIASQVPPDLNADTAAAFLPQIFDRVAQCTRELRMGALNNLKFTVGNVPWHIFHVNAIYFAAFGRAGESLPTAQLAALAGQLDRKKQ